MLSLVSESRGYSLVEVCGLRNVVAPLVEENRLQAHELQQLWYMDLAALQHVESSWARDQTCVPWTGGQEDSYPLYHREALHYFSNSLYIGVQSIQNVLLVSAVQQSEPIRHIDISTLFLVFPNGSDSKESACNVRTQVQSLGWEIPWRREWQSTPIFLPEKSHRQRSLVCYSPWDHKQLDMTE